MTKLCATLLVFLLATSASAQQQQVVVPPMPGASVLVLVGTPTPSPAPTTSPTPPPLPTPSPVPTPPPIAGDGTTYYFSNSGNDSTGNGSQAKPWATVTKALAMIGSEAPGTRNLLKAGDQFKGEFALGDVPAHGVNGTKDKLIQIGVYGQTTQNPYAILDEQMAFPNCISALYPHVPVNGLAISGIECRHATRQGFNFRAPGSHIYVPASNQFQNISFVGNYLHNIGANCGKLNGPCVGSDPGQYANVMVAENDQSSSHSFYIAKNIVRWSDGHNCIQSHGDTASSIIDSNWVGPGCPHNMIDIKMPGDFTKKVYGSVTNNYLDCGYSKGLCGTNNVGSDAIFAMNVDAQVNGNLLVQGNVVTDMGGTRSGFTGSCVNIHPNAVPSGCPSGAVCSIVSRVYNNTCHMAGGASMPTICIGIQPTAGAWGPSNADIRNNICDGGKSSISVSPGMPAQNAQAGVMTTEDANNLGGHQGSSTYSFNGSSKMGAHSYKNVDPIYANEAQADYHLKPGSPMIGVGAPLPVPVGHKNIGAY